MDRDEALRLLKGGPDGIAEWNRRRKSGDGIPDLTNANLREAYLRNANLSGANLSGANLIDANLIDANLGGADFRAANFSGANLRTANFSAANLSDADLSAANLSATDLSGANLSGAKCWYTVFANIDLSGVTGLDSVWHAGPGTIGTDTLARSRGKIPARFLHECGVPEAIIESVPSWISAMAPIQFYSCFISYSTRDEDFVKHLHSRMRNEGLRVWYAPDDIQGGKRLADQIDQAISRYDKLLLVLSPDSLSSEWVKTELRKALKAETKDAPRKLFPIRLVDFNIIKDWECIDPDTGRDLGVAIREYFIPDFSNWQDGDSFESSVRRLLKDLEAPESTGVNLA
jgi:hypothetical protein